MTRKAQTDRLMVITVAAMLLVMSHASLAVVSYRLGYLACAEYTMGRLEKMLGMDKP